MGQAVSIVCQRRDRRTKGYLNQLKKQAMVPGVVYGNEMQALNIATEARQLGRIFQAHGTRALFALGIEGEHVPLMVVVREIQRHPVSGQMTHIDFLQVNMKEKMTGTVGIHLTGEEELLGKDVVLIAGIKEIEITCLPAALPETLVYDVAHLTAGDKVTVSDLKVPEGVEVLTDPAALVVSITVPQKELGKEEPVGEERTAAPEQ